MINININGAKNSALPIIAATLLSKNIYYIKNIPLISDIFVQLNILKQFNIKYQFINKNTIVIDSTELIIPDTIDYNTNTRGTYYFIGSTVGYNKDLIYELDTGCKIDKRSIEYHIDLLLLLGKKVKINQNSIEVFGKCDYKPIIFNFIKPSVGATINGLLMYSFCPFTIILNNYAKDPYIINTIELLQKIGIAIEYNDVYIKIIGEKKNILENMIIIHDIIPDPIEVLTYIIYAGINLEIDHQSLYTIGPININELGEAYYTLENIGIKLINSNIDNYYFIKKSILNKFDIVTGYFPLVYTDIQPFFTILALYIKNQCSTITETIWNERFKYIEEINKLGFDIEVKNNKIIINNENKMDVMNKLRNLEDHEYNCTDLRGGMALLLMMRKLGLKKNPNFEKYIKRGYYDYEKNINIILENKNNFFSNYDTLTLSNIKIGGKCKYYCEIFDEKNLINIIQYCKNKLIKYKLVGGGYNIYFGDYFEGLIIKNLYKKINKIIENDSYTELEISSGTDLIELVIYLMKNNYDITNLTGIPGTIGGACYSNVSAYGLEISSIIKECKILDNNGNIICLNNKEMMFSYRNSILKNSNFNYILLTITCLLENKNNLTLINNNFIKIWKLRYNKFSMEYNLGSIFKNNSNYYAWELIDKCNIRGKTINNITISKNHPNIFYNHNCANPQDLNNLLLIIIIIIYKKFNIILELEIEYISYYKFILRKLII